MVEMKRTQRGQGLQLHVQQLRLTMGSTGTQRVWVALPPAQIATLGPAPLCVFCFSRWLSYDPGFSSILGSPLQPKLHLQSTIQCLSVATLQESNPVARCWPSQFSETWCRPPADLIIASFMLQNQQPANGTAEICCQLGVQPGCSDQSCRGLCELGQLNLRGKVSWAVLCKLGNTFSSILSSRSLLSKGFMVLWVGAFYVWSLMPRAHFLSLTKQCILRIFLLSSLLPLTIDVGQIGEQWPLHSLYSILFWYFFHQANYYFLI